MYLGFATELGAEGEKMGVEMELLPGGITWYIPV